MMTDIPEFEEIAENFELFDDWEDRYRYVIDLGKALPALDETRRTDAAKVEGCASQVWLVPDVHRDDQGAARLNFDGDSDAMIVRGLIAVLRAMVSGQRVEDISAEKMRAGLARLALDQALSAQRSNGLRAMVQRLDDIARSATV